ncbi:hypothetical protein I5Q34_32050 [Streptomyces sp. AV19]|uniref:hypothetical protein n=1 Tax=Streptomyces sp. AV19 TaxID=2793068 RepID=UPI0018FE6521|nr:hypothetical protein [Streptomyces sp. AV19]MBH1938840.1 hypothetical protein [Streptomyces sp. AV19]MDG4533541.1 hypothetical protein [Streptomyces sp. AV19]
MRDSRSVPVDRWWVVPALLDDEGGELPVPGAGEEAVELRRARGGADAGDRWGVGGVAPHRC